MKVLMHLPLAKIALDGYIVDVLNRKQKRHVDILIVLWAVSVGIFTAWWFQPKHIDNPWLFAFNSFVLGWGTVMPAYYFYFLRRMKKPNPECRFRRIGEWQWW